MTLFLGVVLTRQGIGFELNPEYVKMTKTRLNEPFNGFDSVDTRMKRVPNDLRNPEIRRKYLEDYIHWFLRNHDGAIEEFEKIVEEKYGSNALINCIEKNDKSKIQGQLRLLENQEEYNV